jgi:hypothetical protein
MADSGDPLVRATDSSFGIRFDMLLVQQIPTLRFVSQRTVFRGSRDPHAAVTEGATRIT